MDDCITPWGVIKYLIEQNQCAQIFTMSGFNDSYTLGEYLPYFFKTFILEFPVYFIFLKKTLKMTSALKMNLILNLSTHPLIFLIFPIIINYFEMTYLQYLIAAEVFAPTIEALILCFYGRIEIKKAFLISILANLFSWSVGVYWV